MRFGGLGFRVWGVGPCRVWSLIWVWDAGFMVVGLGFSVFPWGVGGLAGQCFCGTLGLGFSGPWGFMVLEEGFRRCLVFRGLRFLVYRA